VAGDRCSKDIPQAGKDADGEASRAHDRIVASPAADGFPGKKASAKISRETPSLIARDATHHPAF